MLYVKKRARNPEYNLLQFALHTSLLIGCCLFTSFCNQKKNSHNPAEQQAAVLISQTHYHLSKPGKTIVLGHELNEISGIAYIAPRTILAHNDEEGKIYTINPDNPENKEYPSVLFGKKGDYEEIVVIDSTAYILKSNGSIFEVTGFYDQSKTQSRQICHFGGKKNEFESLYYDKQAHSLILLCKSCHHENNEIRTAYRFDLSAKKLSDTPYFTINIAAIASKLNSKKASFFPSGAAIHPIQQKLYILSSIGKLMVITDLKGNPEKVMRLDPKIFPQPEGITFAPDGDMYISNEGGDGNATLLKFTYRP